MQLVKRSGNIKLTEKKVQDYVKIYELIIDIYKRSERDYISLDFDKIASEYDKISKWSVMSTVLHKLDRSFRRN